MREASRDKTIERIQELLERAGFFVSDTHSIRPTSFDLVARRDSLLVIIKVLKNIDAFDAEEARRLKELASLFPARALVIGETSGGSRLEPGVVYSRYEVPVLVEESLREFLEKALPPFLFSSPGGVFARIDGGRLRSLRESRGISLGALASVAGVSRRTIQLYEEGAGAEVLIVERLEHFLGEPIVQPIDVFSPVRSSEVGESETEAREEDHVSESAAAPRSLALHPTGDQLRDGVFRQLGGMGWEMVLTLRCPFDAFGRGGTQPEVEILLTGVGSYRSAVHRGEVLHQLARVTEGHSLFVVREAGSRTSVDGTPIVTVTELRRNRDREELLDLIAERESQ